MRAILFTICFILLITIITTAASTNTTNRALYSAEVVYSWVSLEFQWESQQQKQFYIDNSLYISDNCAITGIKVYKDQVYVTIPRWFPGVPWTLAKVVVDPSTGRPVLAPFPNLAVQDISQTNDSMIRYVQSMEIDSRGRMWIVDVGRLNIQLKDPSTHVNGPSHLYIYDLNTNQFVHNFTFPESVVPYDSFLNDIVLDEIHNFAYISNAALAGYLVSYDYNTDTSVAYSATQFAERNETLPCVINGNPIYIYLPLDGIGLSRDAQTVYFTPTTDVNLYSIPSSFFRQTSNLDVTSGVTDLGPIGFKDGLTYSNDDKLYFGVAEKTALNVWSVKTQSLQDSQTIIQNAETNNWVDTFGFDEQGNLWYTQNQIAQFTAKRESFPFNGTEPNFRIWRVFVNSESYIYGQRQILDAQNNCANPTPTPTSTPTPSTNPSCNSCDQGNDNGVTINFYFADMLRGL